MSSIYRKAKPKTFTAKEARQMLGVTLTAEAKADTDRATERQAAALAKFAIQDAEKLSFTEASDLLTALVGRCEEKLCSLRQMAWLMGRGVPSDEAREVPFEDAGKFISESKSW